MTTGSRFTLKEMERFFLEGSHTAQGAQGPQKERARSRRSNKMFQLTAQLFERDRDLPFDRLWRNAKPMGDLMIPQLMKTTKPEDLPAFFREAFYRLFDLFFQLLLPHRIMIVMRREMGPEGMVDIFLFNMPVFEVIEAPVLNGAVDIWPKGKIDQYRFPLLPEKSIGVGDDLLGSIDVVCKTGGEEAQFLIISLEQLFKRLHIPFSEPFDQYDVLLIHSVLQLFILPACKINR
jgi:hypothetical protein